MIYELKCGHVHICMVNIYIRLIEKNNQMFNKHDHEGLFNGLFNFLTV